MVVIWAVLVQTRDSLLSSFWTFLTNHGATKTDQVSSSWIRCPITIEFKQHQRPTVLVEEEFNYENKNNAHTNKIGMRTWNPRCGCSSRFGWSYLYISPFQSCLKKISTFQDCLTVSDWSYMGLPESKHSLLWSVRPESTFREESPSWIRCPTTIEAIG